MEGGVCTVVFSKAFFTDTLERQQTAIHAVVATLTGFDAITSVRVSAENNEDGELLSSTYSRQDVTILD